MKGDREGLQALRDRTHHRQMVGSDQCRDRLNLQEGFGRKTLDLQMFIRREKGS
jgi:hypothetical protein